MNDLVSFNWVFFRSEGQRSTAVFIFAELLIRPLKVGGTVRSWWVDFYPPGLSHLCPGCSHVSEPAAAAEEEETEALCQAGPSLAAVELPRKRKGSDAEAR